MQRVLLIVALLCAFAATLAGFDVSPLTHPEGWIGTALVAYFASLLA